MSFVSLKPRLLTRDQVKNYFCDVAGCDEAKEIHRVGRPFFASQVNINA